MTEPVSRPTRRLRSPSTEHVLRPKRRTIHSPEPIGMLEQPDEPEEAEDTQCQDEPDEPEQPFHDPTLQDRLQYHLNDTASDYETLKMKYQKEWREKLAKHIDHEKKPPPGPPTLKARLQHHLGDYKSDFDTMKQKFLDSESGKKKEVTKDINTQTCY